MLFFSSLSLFYLTSPSPIFFPSGVLHKVREEETSKKKRRLLEKKKKVRRRLVFAVVMDIELVVVAIYTRRRHPCCRFSDPSSLVSVFTVVATTTACHHTGHLSLFQSLSLFLYVDKADELGGGGDIGALVVMGLQRRRKKTIMTLRPRDVEETHSDLSWFRIKLSRNPPHLSFFNVFFFYKTTNPMREEAAGCQITIHDTGREKASSLTDHDLRRQSLL
ncbi:unnamed protein product [Brassica oleracea]